MQLGEIYKLKEDESYKILISRFATDGNEFIPGIPKGGLLIIADKLMGEDMLWTSPSFCLYFKSEKDILKQYDLHMTQQEFQDYCRQHEQE